MIFYEAFGPRPRRKGKGARGNPAGSNASYFSPSFATIKNGKGLSTVYGSTVPLAGVAVQERERPIRLVKDETRRTSSRALGPDPRVLDAGFPFLHLDVKELAPAVIDEIALVEGFCASCGFPAIIRRVGIGS